jgi:hypothetical protein
MVSLLENGDILPGRGQHQETSLTRLGDTCWGSHHRILIQIHLTWDSVISMLDSISHDDTDADERCLTSGYMFNMENLEFVTILH